MSVISFIIPLIIPVSFIIVGILIIILLLKSKRFTSIKKEKLTFREWFDEFGIDYLDIWGQSDAGQTEDQWSFTMEAVRRMIDDYEKEMEDN